MQSVDISSISPMLLKKADAAFDDEGFIYEFKFDGVRAIVAVDEDVCIFNRHQKEKTHLYPEITAAARLLKKGSVLDGEIIAFDASGNISFYSLMQRDGAKRYIKDELRIFYMAFDILYYEGECVTHLPLTKRKQLLEKAAQLCSKGGVIRIVDYYEGEGKMLFEAAQNARIEGIVAKKKDSPYQVGERSGCWQKIKCIKSEQVYIAGYTKTQSRISLCMGKKEGDKFIYVGNVSNGLSYRQWQTLYDKLQSLASDKSYFLDDKSIKKLTDIVYLEPILRADVEYLEMVGGKMRQPVIKNLYY